MEHKQMKQDLFFIKALRSKGYELEDVIKMTDQQIDRLSLSQRIIESIKDYKNRGALPVSEIKEQISNDISIDAESRNLTPEVLNQYVVNNEEQNTVLEEVKKIEEEQNPVLEDEIVITRVVSSKEDLDLIKKSLRNKELKSVSNYIKHLKAEVPEAILSAVDSTVITDLIEERIAEVKLNAK